jgi:hypothetical protein
MTSEEIARILRANVDQRVHVTWDDGQTEWVTVLTVDEEGFVYDRVPPDPATPYYWNRFDEIVEVQPAE